MRATFHVDGVLALALLTVWSFVASVRERIVPPRPLGQVPAALRGAAEPAPAPNRWRWN
ncbi:MAG TPA: hypothetical protein VGG39_00380 [Polyangiaceae bacterium]|jgi:hypothetical protein